MTKSAWTTVLVIAILFLSGCAATTQEIHTSRTSNVNSGSPDVRVDLFGSGETPAVVATGCGGKTVTVSVYNTFSGQVVHEVTGDVAQNRAQWWPLKDMPNGSYQAGLVIAGSTVGAANFVVRR